MAFRINNAHEMTTRDLLLKILELGFAKERTQFLIPGGRKSAELCIARLRVMLSKTRKKRERRGLRQKHFTLCAEIYPWTEQGIRHHCIVMYVQFAQHHEIKDMVEDVIQHG